MLSEFEQNLVDKVDEHGFFSLGVFGNAEADTFRYSIGFWETLHAPEIIICGLELELMHDMICEMFRQVKAGAILADGAPWQNLIEGFDCISRPVHPSQVGEFLLSALWYQRHRGRKESDLRVFQLFWPGAQQGLYPWEAGCDQIVRDCQPALYLPREMGQA